MKTIAILPAAGLSTRMGSTTAGLERKQFLELHGVPVFLHTLRQFDACREIQAIYLALRIEDQTRVRECLAQTRLRLPVQIVEGGETRQDTVWTALQQAPRDTELVAVHDAVRPLVDADLIRRALAAAERLGAVIAAVAAVDTVKQVERAGAAENEARIVTTLPRERIVLAQTPQVFRYELLRRAFEKAASDGFHGTDESSLIEHLGEPVYAIPGSARNLKITTPADLALAERLTEQAEPATTTTSKF